jgi:hypothetical protein
MALDFSAPLAQIFAALGQDATYAPFGGTERTITVLPKQPDVIIGIEGSRLQTPTTQFEVLTADVAAFNKGKDNIIFKETTYIVQNARIKDDLKLVWLVDTYPA